MLEAHEVLILISYMVAVIVIGFQMAKLTHRHKDIELEFDAIHFLRLSFGCSLAALVGFIVLVCALFWTRQSLAVGIISLIGMPSLFMVAAFMQVCFYRRYNRLDNFLDRFEQLSPTERALVLESLPPEQLLQIPGDYRVISWKDSRF